MGDENPIRTLGDYSRPSHEGYRNTIELPEGNNVVPLRSDTIRLVQYGCSFHGLRSEDPNQHLKDFLKLVDSLDLDSENRERTCLCGRLRKLRPDEAWDTIKRLAQYENEGWNDAFTSEEVSFNYENPNVEQLLGIMDHKVNTLMMNAISLIGKSNDIFQSTTNEMRQPPTKPSRQEEFKDIVMKVIYDQEEKIKQLKNYMQDIIMNSWNSLRRGEKREISLLEFGWRIGLYSHEQAIENTTLGRLRNCNTVRKDRLLMEFWPRIGNGMFNMGNTKVASIRDPKVKLAHRCIATTIAARKETTHRITEINLYYLYCIYTLEVACNIPYWLAKYFKGMREKNLIYGGILVTRIARSGEAEGSADLYHNMSQGDWQVHQAHWMGQQDERWGRLDTWMGQQDQRASWMYERTVCQFQYLSTRDNLEPHLQINPFPGFEANYPPYGYQGHMPPGYTYHPYPPQDGSS
ncbi:hypothetical protein Tco_0419317 [Tanacetum coccineum]